MGVLSKAADRSYLRIYIQGPPLLLTSPGTQKLPGVQGSDKTQHCQKICSFKDELLDSLVVQWLRIHLSMQGTQIPFLVREDLHAAAQQSPCITTTQLTF